MILTLIVILLIIFLMRYNFYRIPKKGIVVLLYHSIDNNKYSSGLDKFTVSPNNFEKHVKFIKKMGYQSIKSSQIQTILDNKLYRNQKFVFFTFDDGYKNNLEAAKILKKYNYTGMFFISTAYIGSKMDNVDMLDGDDIKELIDMGMEIGSHSHVHKHLSEMSMSEIVFNLKTSKEILSNYAHIEDFAYPFGNFNNAVIEELKRHGFKRAYIIGQAINTSQYNPYLIKRSIIRKSSNYLDLYLILTRGRSRI